MSYLYPTCRQPLHQYNAQKDSSKEELTLHWTCTQCLGKKDIFDLYTIYVRCSSGTYIRTLVNSLGEALETGAVSLKISRLSIGDYSLDDSLEFKILSV